MTKLLGFMSSWDRSAKLEEYTALLDTFAEDVDLVETLGTPTKVAIDLARDYIPTPPPAKPVEEAPSELDLAFEEMEKSEEEEVPSTAAEEVAVQETPAVAEPVAEDTIPMVKPRKKPGMTAVYTIACILIGLPIAIVLIALGVPVLMFGVGCIVTAVLTLVTILGSLSLISDTLLLIGGAIVVAAIGLLLLWLGLWIRLELGWLWIGKLIFPLGKKLCFVKEGN